MIERPTAPEAPPEGGPAAEGAPNGPPAAAAMKLAARTAQAALPRPHHVYKREFADRIAALSPESLLDVGCGEGARLRDVSRSGCRAVGLEVNEAVASAARAGGLDVRPGRAEALPFSDRSFDVVVFEYTTHHVERLDGALLEAARVARRAVLILDGWYDITLPSQRLARDFDEWSKTIDRRAGMVHNPCPSAAELAAPFLALGGFRLDWSHRLVLQPVPLPDFEAGARAQLAGVGSPPELAAELSRLLDRAFHHGLTDDGALSFSAVRA